MFCSGSTNRKRTKIWKGKKKTTESMGKIAKNTRSKFKKWDEKWKKKLRILQNELPE